MDWEALQDAIKAWFTGITGLTVVWENEKRPHLLRDAFGILSTPSEVTSVGQDYYRETTSVDPDEIDPEVVGQRVFQVGCRVVSRSQTANKTARWYTERARLSLKFPTVLTAFQTAGIAVVNALPTFQFDAPWDQRFESISAFNLLLATTATLTDSTPVGTIGTIAVSSNVAPAPTPPNLDDELFEID